MIAVSLSIILFLMASSSVPSLQPYSVALRAAGAAILIAPMLIRKRSSQHTSMLQLDHASLFVGFGFFTYMIASTFVHDFLDSFMVGLASALLVGCLIRVLWKNYSQQQLILGAYTATLAICLLSIVGLRIAPDIAVENLRLRGLMENANGLGFVALILGAVSIAGRVRLVLSAIGLFSSLACMALSGSRASVLSLIIIALTLAIRGVGRARLAIAITSITVVVAWALIPSSFRTAALLRTTNTRAAGFDMMQQAMSDSFWIGQGKSSAGLVVAGSPFAAGTTGGMFGLVGLGIMYIGLLRYCARSGPRSFALVIGGILHSMFEAWMLSFSAPMLLVYLVVLVGFMKLDSVEVGPDNGLRPDRPLNALPNYMQGSSAESRT